jgi:hypothetical protein
LPRWPSMEGWFEQDGYVACLIILPSEIALNDSLSKKFQKANFRQVNAENAEKGALNSS